MPCRANGFVPSKNFIALVVSEHLCGIAIAYTDNGQSKKKGLLPSPGREQGSLISYQKRQVADAVELIRRLHEHSPKIFVATTSPAWNTSDATCRHAISSFTHNLRNGYGMNEYVWVKEYAKNGAPHWHFVADLPWLEKPLLVHLSNYWAGLFQENANNCVRFGSKPDPETGKRIYEIKTPKHAFYLCKYLGKEFGAGDDSDGKRFRISRNAAAMSKPVKFEVNYSFRDETKTVLTESGYKEITLSYPTGTVMRDTFSGAIEIFDKTLYKWKKVDNHNVWFGRLRDPNSANSRHSSTQTNWRKKLVTPTRSQEPTALPLNTLDDLAHLNCL